MTTEEFFAGTGTDIALTPEKWDVIQTVYAYHPAITDVEGKQQIFALWKIGGYGMMQEMLVTACIAKSLEKEAQELRAEISKQEGLLLAKIAEMKNFQRNYKNGISE